MPGRLKVKILSGRHLPIMDRASELTDAFVEVKFASVTHKTDVCSKSLNPSWNSEWFTFEVDDKHLQDEPLQIRVLDHDTYSSHDAIGKVYIDIDPLLSPDTTNALHGWFPIYDTMHGIRGEILLSVKIELFADFNRFKKSSCGIKFICGTVVPECYRISAVKGFVEELVVSEDPEYQWIDRLRTPRATNEARQRLFSQVSGELQRRIGRKVFEMGGNAVVGYHQHFDIEGEFGVVVRGIGTAVSLELQIKILSSPQPMTPTSQLSFSPATTSLSESPLKFTYPPQSSSLDSDLGPIITAGGTYPFQSWNANTGVNEGLETMETPFFTLTEFPSNFLIHLGGVVSAHSVKLLDKIHNPDAPETRDAWWGELRREIKSHASLLSCNAVVGYKEFTSICDELVLLSAQGTAAVVNLNLNFIPNPPNEAVMARGAWSAAVVLDSINPFEKIDVRRRHNSGSGIIVTPPRNNTSLPIDVAHSNVELFRVPYHADAPFPIKISYSPLDGTVQVPEVLFTTIDIPNDVHITGKGMLIQARFCRSKKKCQGEAHAAVVGDIIPFVEYELHKQLYNKLKLRGMNALFGLNVRIRVGENLVIGIATATAAYVTALPLAEKPDLTCQNVKKGSSMWENSLKVYNSEVEKSRNFFNLRPPDVVNDQNSSEGTGSSDSSLLNASSESKQALPVSIEDPDDLEQLRAMIDPLPPEKCYVSNCQHVPGINTVLSNLQTFSMFWRVKYREGAGDRHLNRALNATCEKTFASMWHRLSRLCPAFCVCGVRFNLLVPEDDEIHIWISASAVAYKNIEDTGKLINMPMDNLQFRLEIGSKNERSDESDVDSISPLRLRMPLPALASHGSSPEDQLKGSLGKLSGPSRHSSGGSAAVSACRHVELVPMSYIPGRRIQRHIGFLNMFLIRETSNVRGGEEGLPGTEPQRGTGSNWFAHSAFAEAQAMLRAHVAALGGNALTSYRIEQCTLDESVAKNQAQCLIHVCGDAVISAQPRQWKVSL